jgi:transcription initiation factor TFIIIB Brf1 subunit/transcription initiation factor TFIIB
MNKSLESLIEKEECAGGCGYSGDYITDIMGFSVCPECGIVQNEHSFSNELPRIYDSVQEKNKARTNVVLSKYAHRTEISDEYDCNNNPLSPETKYLFYRLSKLNKSSNKKNYFFAEQELKAFCKKFFLSELIYNDSWKIYKEYAKGGLNGRSINTVIAASAYVGARINNKKIDLKTIISNYSIQRKRINRVIIEMNNDILPLIGRKNSARSPVDTIIEKSNAMNLPYELQQKALSIYEKASEKNSEFKNTNPPGLAAAIIYIAAKPYKITQKDIAKKLNLTDATIRNYYKK